MFAQSDGSRYPSLFPSVDGLPVYQRPSPGVPCALSSPLSAPCAAAFRRSPDPLIILPGCVESRSASTILAGVAGRCLVSDGTLRFGFFCSGRSCDFLLLFLLLSCLIAMMVLESLLPYPDFAALDMFRFSLPSFFGDAYLFFVLQQLGLRLRRRSVPSVFWPVLPTPVFRSCPVDCFCT